MTAENAHPHVDCSKTVAVVHNGTIENFAELKDELVRSGHAFTSETDTEVLAHLIEEAHRDQSIGAAVEQALARIVGAYGIAVISRKEPDRIIAARRGSPLLIGIGQDCRMVASDRNAFMEYCTQVLYLEDNEIIEIQAHRHTVAALGGGTRLKMIHELERAEEEVGKGTYPYFMLKEIMDQPAALQSGLSGRLNSDEGVPVLGGIRDIMPQLARIRHVILTGCGTAYHAALWGKCVFEQLVGVTARAEIASELFFERVNEPPDATLVLFISQSGETSDLRDVLVELKRRGYLCCGVINVAGSTIAREIGVGIYIRAGVERAVASTKAFTSQITALMLLAVTMARQRSMSRIEGQQILDGMRSIPDSVERLLVAFSQPMYELARELASAGNLYFLGKKYSFPVALEAALKVKEITYIATEALPAGELKHGPLALVDQKFVCFMIAPEANLFSRYAIAIEEIAARGGRVWAVVSEKLAREKVLGKAEGVYHVPHLPFNFLYPFLTVLPFQLFAYHLSVLLGRNPDKPRNLAKSVTVP